MPVLFNISSEFVTIGLLLHSMVSVSGLASISDKNHESIDDDTVIAPRIRYGSSGETMVVKNRKLF